MPNRATIVSSARNLPPIDETVPLPPAVRAAAEAAEALQKAQANQPSAEPQPDPQTPQPSAEPQPDPQPPQPQAQQASTPPSNEPPNYEHLYNSQLGRVRQLTKTNETLTARLESMQASMDAMQVEMQRRPASASTVAPIDTSKLFTEQQRADYGEEMLNIITTTAQTIAQNIVDTRTHDINSRLDASSQAMAVNAKDRMHAYLDLNCPDWQKINYEDEFNAWLRLPDEYSGDIRHTLLNKAYERNDGPRVAKFFKGFLSEKAATEPAPSATLPATVPPTAQLAKPSLEDFAAPGRARTAATSTSPAEKPVISHSDIAGFYEDVRKGVYRGRQEEQARLEAMIFEAQRDGRVRQG